MDHLLAIGRSLAEQAYFQVTDLLNLEVDLLFFDPTSTCSDGSPTAASPRSRTAGSSCGAAAGTSSGEKLRSGTPEVKAALSRQGRCKTVRDNLQVKEVRLGDDTDRFIICYNPDQAERDAAIRARLAAQLEEVIAGSDDLTAAERGRLEGSLTDRPGLKRFLRVTPGGLLRTDKARISAEEDLDGK